MSNFETTQWSVVLAAGDADSPGSREALEALCEIYWYPLYAYARRRGQNEENARDLTQGFFAKLLEKNWVAAADRERGKFRTFMLTAFFAPPRPARNRQLRSTEPIVSAVAAHCVDS